MKIILPRLYLLLMVFTFLICRTAAAQDNLETVRVDELSDQQVVQLLQKANTAGLNDNQLVQLAESRGMTVSEGIKLQKRIETIRKKAAPVKTADSTQLLANASGRTLTYRADSDSLRKFNNRDLFRQLIPQVFGADIFQNGNQSFAPNLRIATPLNYIVGPDDQLNISVYGNSQVNWKLEVSPEGSINIPGSGILDVAGKTIEQTTLAIKSKLAASHYDVGRGTQLQVSLGNIRSIKIIMIGELKKPGTYTLPSLATAFNALYAAGGPSDNGSYRQIEIIRNGKIIRQLDIYDFLVKGDQKDNVLLHDQDIIRVPSYKIRAELAGEIKHPALYEVLPGETFADLLRFAGGFTDEAYTARIKVLQVSDQQRKISDVAENDFSNYVPLRGDKFVVERILDRYENRVRISGAVFRPGDYALEKGLTLSGLIRKAAGLKEDAFTGRGTITRLRADNTPEMLSFNVEAILERKTTDIALRREDSIHIASLFDLRDPYKISIKGEVRHPGEFSYADSMSIADLIIRAGGLAEGASPKRIEVARRLSDGDPNSKTSRIAMVFRVDLDSSLNFRSAEFKLRPFDIVSVYSLPGYEKQRVVKVSGEVLYPGYYTVENKNERISDLVKRAGGLTASADIDGSTLKRLNTVILGIDKNKADSATLLQERSLRLKHIQQVNRDSSLVQSEPARNDLIGINLRNILGKPGSFTDLIVENGDELRVPKQQQIVRVNGEVLFPSAVIYDNSKGLRDYVLNAGGFSVEALRRGTYVVYANGTVRGTRKFLFFNVHPEVKPGSEIYVPKRPYHRPLSTTEVIGLGSGIASFAAIVLGILTLTKK